MTQKALNINCQAYLEGLCMHYAAPRKWFGPPACILDSPIRMADPRILPGCALQYEYPKPTAPIAPPPTKP